MLTTGGSPVIVACMLGGSAPVGGRGLQSVGQPTVPPLKDVTVSVAASVPSRRLSCFALGKMPRLGPGAYGPADTLTLPRDVPTIHRTRFSG